MSQMAKGLVMDIAMKLVADESQEVIEQVRIACETDAEAERRAELLEEQLKEERIKTAALMDALRGGR